MNDYGWGMFKKGLKRRSKEVRRMRIMTCLAVFFLAFTLLLQDNLNAYRMEMNYRSYGSWAVRSEDNTFEGNAALTPCGVISRGSMIYRAYPDSMEIDPETEEPYGDTRFDVTPKDYIELPIGGSQRSTDFAIGVFSDGLAEEQHIGIYEGRYPEADDEIAMELSLLSSLGVSYEMGQELSFYVAEHDDKLLINAECERLYLEACAEWQKEHPGEEPPEEPVYDDDDEWNEDDEDDPDDDMDLGDGDDDEPSGEAPSGSGYPQRWQFTPETVFGSKKLHLVTFRLVGTMERYSMRWDGEYSNRAELPSAIVTKAAYDRLEMDKVEHRLYELAPELKKGRVWENAGELFKSFESTYIENGVPCTLNRSAYENTLWGNSTVFRRMTLLLIVLSACIIAYLMAAYLGKRRQFFLRMREIGATTGEVWRMAAYECVLSVLPAALITFAAAYVCGALAVLIVSLLTGMRYFFTFRLSTMLLILCSIAATLLLSLAAALVIFMGRGVSRKRRTMSRLSARGVRRRGERKSHGSRAYLGLGETMKRDRRMHRIKTWALRIVSVLVCAAIIFCAVNVWRAGKNYYDQNKLYPDFMCSVLGVYIRKGRVPLKPDEHGNRPGRSATTWSERGDCYTYKSTFVEDFMREVSQLPGVRSVKWEGLEMENAHLNWQGKDEDEFFRTNLIWYLTESNPFRSMGEFDPDYNAEKYMYDMEETLFMVYGTKDSEATWDVYKNWLDPSVADKQAFLRGDQVIVAVDTKAEFFEMEYKSSFGKNSFNEAGTDLWEEYGHSFDPGDNISLEYLDKVIDARIAGVLPMDSGEKVVRNSHKIMIVICSEGYLARVASVLEKETGYNRGKITLDELSVNENTVKSLSRICAKYNVSYDDYVEIKVECRSEFIRSLITYGFFAVVLTVLFLFVISSVHRDEEARLEEKYRILRRSGMPVSAIKKQKCADAALQTLWLIPSLLIHSLLTILMWDHYRDIIINLFKKTHESGESATYVGEWLPFIKYVILPQVAIPCLLLLMLACWLINRKLMIEKNDNDLAAERR